MSAIRLIAGLGNPGPQYESTRHNAGAWYLQELADHYRVPLSRDSKFHGWLGKGRIADQDIWLLRPDDFMNLNGKAIGALAGFFKIEPEEILIAYDELDLPPGVVRLKQGGSSGHNGIRDTVAKLGNNRNFFRLRIGIGHPGDKSLVTPYVLGKPPAKERDAIITAIDEAVRETGRIVTGERDKVMQTLHSLPSPLHDKN